MATNFSINDAVRNGGGFSYSSPSSTSKKKFNLKDVVMAARSRQSQPTNAPAPRAQQQAQGPARKSPFKRAMTTFANVSTIPGVGSIAAGPAAAFAAMSGQRGNRPQTPATPTEPTVPVTGPTQTGTADDYFGMGGDTSGGGFTFDTTGGGRAPTFDTSSSSSSSMMGGTPLSITSPFGDGYQTYESLLAMRNGLSRLRQQSEIGETISNEDLKALTGMDAFDPNQLDAIESAKADNFNAPISYIDALLDREMRIAESRAESQGSSPFGEAGSYGDPVKSAAMSIISRLPATQQDAAAQTVNNYLAMGEIDAAKDFLRDTAIQQMPAVRQEEMFDYGDIIDNLDAAAKLMQTMQAKGMDTGILQGKKQAIARWLGTQTDPEITQLAFRAQNGLDLLSRQRTGAAMTPNEEKFYGSMFPNIGNNYNLNQVLNDQMISAIRKSYDSRLGLAFDTYAGNALNVSGGGNMGNVTNNQSYGGSFAEQW